MNRGTCGCQPYMHPTFSFFIVNRLLERAVKFRFSLPFINPARAPTSLIKLDNTRMVLMNPQYKGNNAVFIMTGHVTECNLLTGIASVEPNMFNNNQAGPLVKRIRVRFFSVEYERFCSFIGLHLQLNDDRSYVGPTTINGVVLSTRKFGFSENCELLRLFGDFWSLLIVAASSTPTTPSSNRFLTKSPARSRMDSDSSGVTLVNNIYPAFLTFGSNGQFYFVVFIILSINDL